MTEKCEHCGNIHELKCPLVKSVDYYENGTIKRIEYLTPADYATSIQCTSTIPVYQYPTRRPIPNTSYYDTTCGSHSVTHYPW